MNIAADIREGIASVLTAGKSDIFFMFMVVNSEFLHRCIDTQMFLFHGFYNHFLEFRRISFVWYSFWHNKSPHLLDSISYCLTNGVLFNCLHSGFYVYFLRIFYFAVTPPIYGLPRCASRRISGCSTSPKTKARRAALAPLVLLSVSGG